ncbi:hypothetical protein [Flavobacterium kingsejongi]|uniref:hypothetical protein n=1 Tax=Flavobacterium kingsejongi TaxID=1678728 RepID=UPI001300B646|nr:hypothetical protein [Flavobacterium kingsejongi]
MAINKTAKNLYITITQTYSTSSKTFLENAEKVEVVATGTNLTLISNKKVAIKGKK